MSENSEEFKFILVEEKDIPLVLEFRKTLFKEMGVPDQSFIDNAYEILNELYIKELKEGRIRHYIAYDSENVPVAIAGAILKNDFPYFLFKPGYYGWIIDVYTVPQFRGKKLATKLLKLTHQWLLQKGAQEAKLIAAGGDARKLYETLEYRDTWEMSLNLSGNRTYNEIIDLKGNG